MGQGGGEGEDEPGKASDGEVRVCPSQSTSTQGTRACASGGVKPPQRPLSCAPTTPKGFWGMDLFLGWQLWLY